MICRRLAIHGSVQGVGFRASLAREARALGLAGWVRNRVDGSVEAVVAGDARFFLGTDSAPHAARLKEHAAACAGCYTAPHALELYATAFEQMGALDRLEAFASCNGPDFYRLPRNTARITLRRETWTIPESLPFGADRIVPLAGGETIGWKLVA